MRICVYCASSNQADQRFRDAAYRLGELLAMDHHCVVYGGGSTGSMGALANGALAQGGEVVGIIPRFMTDLEWQHPGIADMQIVADMRERKRHLLAGSDAVVALPGGCGTLDELFEAMALKRLGRYSNPIVLLDTLGYWEPLEAFLQQTIEQHFMNPEHAGLWTRVGQPEDVLPAIANTARWGADARDFAVAR